MEQWDWQPRGSAGAQVWSLALHSALRIQLQLWRRLQPRLGSDAWGIWPWPGSSIYCGVVGKKKRKLLVNILFHFVVIFSFSWRYPLKQRHVYFCWRICCNIWGHENLLLCFPLRVLALIFRSSIHFKLYMVWCKGLTSLLHVAIQLYQCLCWKGPFPTEMSWYPCRNQLTTDILFYF